MTTFGAIARRGGGWLSLVGGAALVGTATTLALPAVLGGALDSMVAGTDAGHWFALAAGLIAVGVVCELVDAYAGTACTATTTAWLRDRLVRHLLVTGPAGTRGFATGDLVSRVSGNATEAAQAGLSAIMVVLAVIPPVGSLVLLAVIDVWLAAAFLAGAGLVAVVLRAFTRRTAEAVMEYQRTQGRLAARLTESLAGARTIAAAGTVEREERRVLEPLETLHQHGVRIWRVLSRTGAQSVVVGVFALVAVLAAGGLALAHGRISTGELLAASRYAMIGVGLGALTSVFGWLARSRAGLRRTGEVFAVPAMRYGPRPLPDGPGRLEFRAVSVDSLLHSVDLDLPGGTAVAVVGRSGAGKSVLAALAGRLRDPDSGRVLLDGVPLPQLRREALRSAVGSAFERPVLVGGTLADAIGLGQPRHRVLAAARDTHAHEFVTRLPKGYDTPLVDAPLSGGEAQRVGLARAWHAERLLVLDDAMSSLDMVTEMQISRTLTGDHGRRTRLIVTHRATTAARADLVVWLDHGRVRGVGTHADLWQDAGYRSVFG